MGVLSGTVKLVSIDQASIVHPRAGIAQRSFEYFTAVQFYLPSSLSSIAPLPI
jgi:hypothetical protein